MLEAYILMEVLVKLLHNITFLLVIIGAINWGLIGLIGMNFVTSLFGSMPHIEKYIYILIGIAGVIFALQEVSEHRILQ